MKIKKSFNFRKKKMKFYENNRFQNIQVLR